MTYRNEIKVRRPNGEVETYTKENDRDWSWIVEAVRGATREAGRGEIISIDGYTTDRKPIDNRCKLYTRDQGCPLHGEQCADGRN